MDGGRLITKGSAQEAGFHNWTKKRDWRRDFDQEITREGTEYFRPNLAVALGNQPFPQNQPTPPSTVEPITLQCQVRALNGRTAFIAGTPTTLFRYYALEELGYFEDELDQAYWPGAVLGQNLVTAATGNYTINNLIVGKKYRWKPGAGESQLVVSGGATYESYGSTPGLKALWWHPEVGLDFIPTNASVTVSGSSGPAAGTIQEVLEEAYVEELGNASATVVSAEDAFIDWMVNDHLQVLIEGILFRRRQPGTISPSVQVLINDDGSVTGNDALVTWDGNLLHVKIDSGVTTRATIEAAIRDEEDAAEFMEMFQVYGGSYVSPGGGPYFERSGANAPYFIEDTGTWRVIGEGFSTKGHRWEVKQVGDYVVFNNGKDLPVTYQIDDDEVTPIYELREQGVAYVGTIGVVNDILLCGDVAQILEAKLPEVCGHTDSGLITASQTGSKFSGSITVARVGVTNDVQTTGAVAFFEAGWVGRTIQFANGFTTTITAFVSNSRVTLADAPSSVGAEPHVFWVVDLTNDYLVNCSAGFFTAGMIGQSLYWDDTGVSRKIMQFNSTTQVKVDNHLPVPSGLFQLENSTAYGRYEESANVVRNQLKYIWGIPGDPRRWGAVFSGAISVGSTRLELTYPSRSLTIGMRVTITGAGVSGGNHDSEILYIGANLTTITLKEPASTTVTGADVQASDTLGSIIGEDELPTDSSGILRIEELGGALAIYKGESIIFGRYTADPEAPWAVGGPGGVVRTTLTPFYRWTLVGVTVNGQDMHVYAGRNGFYSVTLATRKPREIPVLQACKDMFFGEAKLSDTELIFSAENVLTKEICFFWPGQQQDHGLCWDYEYNTVSTTAQGATSACSIKKPMQEATLGVAEDWFVMGDDHGRVLRYGKADVPQEAWGGATAIYNRLGSRYGAALHSGLWGKRFGEFQLSGYLLELSSQNPGPVSVGVRFLGYDSVAGTPRALGGIECPLAQLKSMIPTAFLAQWMQDIIEVEVLNTPCALSSRTIYGEGIDSKSISRTAP
jgi:hypothetical protein